MQTERQRQAASIRGEATRRSALRPTAMSRCWWRFKRTLPLEQACRLLVVLASPRLASPMLASPMLASPMLASPRLAVDRAGRSIGGQLAAETAEAVFTVHESSMPT
jgi:hypothetical protein